MTGLSQARARAEAEDGAFSRAFFSLQAQMAERESAATASSSRVAEEKAASCVTVWDAARHGVPVKRLQELMEQKIAHTRSARATGSKAPGQPLPSRGPALPRRSPALSGVPVVHRIPRPPALRYVSAPQTTQNPFARTRIDGKRWLRSTMVLRIRDTPRI